MRIVSIFSSANAYRDRVLSSLELGRYAIENIVIAKETLAIDASHCSNSRMIVPDRPMSGLRYFFWASSTVRRVISESGEQDWLVTEVAGGYTLLLLRMARCKAKLVIHLVMPAITLHLLKGWAADPFCGNFSLAHRTRLRWKGFRWAMEEGLCARVSNGFKAN